MIREVAPAIPLNPADRDSLVLDQVDVDGLMPVDDGSVPRLQAREIVGLIPPSRDVGFGEPFLEQREVGTRE
jgi:hypothetical protein